MVSAIRSRIAFLYVGLIAAAGSAPAFPATEYALEAARNRATRILFIGSFELRKPELVLASVRRRARRLGKIGVTVTNLLNDVHYESSARRFSVAGLAPT